LNMALFQPFGVEAKSKEVRRLARIKVQDMEEF